VTDRNLRSAIAVVGVLATAACATRSASGGSPSVHAVSEAGAPRTKNAALEREVFELVNRYRRARGATPLVLDARIGEQARRHSVAMANGSTPVGHRGFDDRVQALRRVMACRRSAENVGMNHGYRDPASQVVRGWIESEGHRKNIEGPYESTGIGVVSDAAGTIYFTQIFVGR
jgi:uncharacterized protein YkwD